MMYMMRVFGNRIRGLRHSTRGVYGRLPKKRSQKSGFEPAKMDICNISTDTLNLKVKLVANETGEGKKGAEKKKKRNVF